MAALNEFIPTLLPPPARVLEVGCGEGELAVALSATGYHVLAIDPEAPEGPIFRRVMLEELEGGPFDLAVADRVLHHVEPLGPAVEKLAALAPLLLVQEFAWELIDPKTQAWYESLHRTLSDAGRDPSGPPDLDRWRLDHADLHRSDVVLRALGEPYEQERLDWGPYFHRWMKLPEVEVLERAAIQTGTIRPIGYRWVGRRRRER